MPTKRGNTSSSSSSSSRKRNVSSSSSSSRHHNSTIEENENSDVDDIFGLSQNSTFNGFSQQVPDEPTEEPAVDVRDREENIFKQIAPVTQDKMVTLLARYILFQALSGGTLVKGKAVKEAWAGQDFALDGRVSNLVLKKACTRIKDVWGVEVRHVPEFMRNNKSLPNKYKDRLYIVNCVKDDERGSHSKKLHGVHMSQGIEKGLLMLVLAFVYCRGDMKNEIRWITDIVLYDLLYKVDNNFPAEPPTEAGRGKGSKKVETRRVDMDDMGVALTPNVDELLEKFVQMDYLMKKKTEKDGGQTQVVGDVDGFSYAIGPRAILEIGRKQIIYFCAEILDEQPCETMLAEINNDDETEEDEE